MLNPAGFTGHSFIPVTCILIESNEMSQESICFVCPQAASPMPPQDRDSGSGSSDGATGSSDSGAGAAGSEAAVQLAAAQQRCKALEAELAEASALKAQLAASQKRCVALESQLAAASAQACSPQGDASGEVAVLKAQLVASQQRCDSLEAQLAGAQRRLEAATAVAASAGGGGSPVRAKARMFEQVHFLILHVLG